jgi:hypothetical protein
MTQIILPRTFLAKAAPILGLGVPRSGTGAAGAPRGLDREMARIGQLVAGRAGDERDDTARALALTGLCADRAAKRARHDAALH